MRKSSSGSVADLKDIKAPRKGLIGSKIKTSI
jgi:hypothetical protein